MMYLVLFASNKSFGRQFLESFPDGFELPVETLLMVCCLLKHGLDVYETGFLLSTCEFTTVNYHKTWVRYQNIITNLAPFDKARLSGYLNKLVQLRG